MIAKGENSFDFDSILYHPKHICVNVEVLVTTVCIIVFLVPEPTVQQAKVEVKEQGKLTKIEPLSDDTESI